MSAEGDDLWSFEIHNTRGLVVKRWIANLGPQHAGVFMQVVMACILALTATVAWSNWKSESGKRQTDATLRYFDRLMGGPWSRTKTRNWSPAAGRTTSKRS
jgi:hypothetical protein